MPYDRHYSREESNRQVFYQYGFGENLSSVPQKKLTEIICGLAMKGNQSRTTDFAELNQGFRTSYGHFLSKGKWDEQKVSQQQQTQALRKADELALAKGAPIYLSIDDTVIEKKKPSLRATRPMEGKQVFGYQVFGANISTGDFSLCYCLRRCCSESGSKIDMAVQLLDTLICSLKGRQGNNKREREERWENGSKWI